MCGACTLSKYKIVLINIWPCCIVLGYDVVLEDRGREGDGEREGVREGGSEGRRE